jgi:hypothetical protein
MGIGANIMIRHLFIATFCCVTMASCVTMPTQQNDGISIDRVVDRVKCELGKALKDNHLLESWAGVITLTLEVDQTGSVSPSTNLVGPFNAGTYGLNIGAGVTGKSVQTSLVNIYFAVYELLDFADRCPIAPQSQLEDSLGLTEWIDRTLALKTDEGVTFDKDKAIGYTLEFDLDLTAGVTPGFTFTRVNGTVGLSVDHKTVNTLEIALADANIKPPKRVATLVRVPPPTGEIKPAEAPLIGDDHKQPAPQSYVYEKRVTRRGTRVGDDTKKRLDVIIQQLQLKNLRARGF